MVVLSCSITTKSGKPLLSRQFVEMTRLRIEGLLLAFPKLALENNSTPTTTSRSSRRQQSKQHTYVETDAIRYIYQPVEELYILLLTTKSSNIVEDLETLRLLSKIVPDVAGGARESDVTDKLFELIFAFDEVMTSGGYKEQGVSMQNVKKNLEMDSHEEKLHKMIKESKEETAREEGKRQAKVIKERQVSMMKQMGQMGGGGPPLQATTGPYAGFGGGGPTQNNDMFNDPFGQFGNNNNNNNNYDNNNSYNNPPAPPSESPQPPRVVAKGMKLGLSKKKNDNSMMMAMAAEDNLGGASLGLGGGNRLGGASSAAAPVDVPQVPTKPVSIVAEEKISCQMNREGEVVSCEVKGTLTLTACNDAASGCKIEINKGHITDFTMNTHPKVDKNEWEMSSLLGIKGGKGYPVNRPVGVLRWSKAGPALCPLSLNVWPEEEGDGHMTVNIEYELLQTNMTLTDVNVFVPLGTTEQPRIGDIDGQFKHNGRDGVLLWHNAVIGEGNATGSIEFTVPGGDANAFFPVQVQFGSTLYAPIEVTACENADGPVEFEMVKRCVPDQYAVN